MVAVETTFDVLVYVINGGMVIVPRFEKVTVPARLSKVALSMAGTAARWLAFEKYSEPVPPKTARALLLTVVPPLAVKTALVGAATLTNALVVWLKYAIGAVAELEIPHSAVQADGLCAFADVDNPSRVPNMIDTRKRNRTFNAHLG